ncbi:MAG: hypothetical protein R3B99_07290 [Polyangiales bacterium]
MPPKISIVLCRIAYEMPAWSTPASKPATTPVKSPIQRAFAGLDGDAGLVADDLHRRAGAEQHPTARRGS